MIPIQCILDVYMKRTLHVKVNQTIFDKHLEALNYFIVTIIRTTFSLLLVLDTIKRIKKL
jgi:hypothetical protein